MCWARDSQDHLRVRVALEEELVGEAWTTLENYSDRKGGFLQEQGAWEKTLWGWFIRVAGSLDGRLQVETIAIVRGSRALLGGR